jgi:hypothetical protein
MTGSIIRVAVMLLGLCVLMSQLGCAFGEVYWDDPLKREYSLGEIQKQYTHYLRFGNVQAAARFVDPELQDQFYERFPSRDTVVFTDFESGPIKFDDIETRMNATILVTYSGYYSDSLIVLDIIETQEWYRSSAANDWKVRPDFEGLRALAVQ